MRGTSESISMEDGDFDLGSVDTDVRARGYDLVTSVQLHPQLLKHTHDNQAFESCCI